MIPASDLGGVTPEPTPPPPKQWWVSSRWLTDSDQFNEWMTEEDYELIIVVRTILLPSCSRNIFECTSVNLQDERLQQTAPYLGLTRRKFIKTSPQSPDEVRLCYNCGQ